MMHLSRNVITFGLLVCATASNAETPTQFVQRYFVKERADPGLDTCSQFCEPSLWHLVKHANDKGEAVLDYDAFCQCQDIPPMPRLQVKSTTQATATVALKSRGVAWTMVLHRNNAGWHIADVIEKNTGSLKARLAQIEK